MKERQDVYHSPDWYRERCHEDARNPIAMKMLISDCGDNYDPQAIPEELVDLYEERWNSPDFLQ